MRVLQVHDFFARGNSRYGFDLCRSLARRGHEVHILAAVDGRGPGDGEVVEGVRFHTYPFAPSRNPVSHFRGAIERNRLMMTRLHQTHRFDVVHFNQPLCCIGVLQSPAGRDVARKYTFHSPWAVEWSIARRESGRNGAAGGTIGRVIGLGQTWMRDYLESLALRGCSGIAMASGFMKRQLRQRHPEIDRRKLHIIEIGVDTEKFRPRADRVGVRSRLGIGTNDVLLLTIRRLVPRMGIDNLIAAMPSVTAEWPGARLVIGGEGPSRESLERAAASLPCRDRIRFIGQVPEEEIADWYAAADLFVLPTRELEGFGMVIIESMACGTPVIGTPVGAIPEVLGRFDPSLLFGDHTPEAISSGIARVIRSGMLSDALRSHCRSHIEERYRLDRVAEKFESFLVS